MGEQNAATYELRKLLRNLAKEERIVWNARVAAFLIGELAEAELLDEANGSTDHGKRRLAEAWFFVGSKRLLDGDESSAAHAFNKALEIDTWTPPACSTAAAELRALDLGRASRSY